MNRASANRRQRTTRDRCGIGQADLGTGEGLDGASGVREESASASVQVEYAAVVHFHGALVDQAVDAVGVYEEGFAAIVGVNHPTRLVDDADAVAEVTSGIRIALDGVVEVRRIPRITGTRHCSAKSRCSTLSSVVLPVI